MPAEQAGAVAGVVLAAGTSTRMGENKLLFDLHGESVVRGAVLRAAAAGLDPLIAVLGHEAERVRRELDGLAPPCRIVVNPDYARGINSSLKAGIAAIPATAVSAAVVMLADMPFVTAEMIATLVERYRASAALLVISDYEGVNAPPMLYDRSLFNELQTIEGEGCGRQVVRRHRTEAEVVSWPATALTDLDVPSDYERVRSLLAAGRTAVIVGGAGRMGRWLGRFLSAQGYTTGALDPAAAADENDWARRVLPSADLVVCATPPTATIELYADWSAKPPAGVVVDIASIKTPLIEPIRALQRAGACVASIHPMFGPSTVRLRDVDVVICDTGDSEATTAVEKLFQPNTAHIVRLLLADHDRIMADLLSLSHAAAIAFALALPQTEHPVRSTTFRALESLAGAVVRESPDVYYEIQAMNPYSALALERLRAALDRIVTTVTARDSEGFRALLEEGQRRTP